MMLNGGKSHGEYKSAVARAAGGGCAGWPIAEAPIGGLAEGGGVAGDEPAAPQG